VLKLLARRSRKKVKAVWVCVAAFRQLESEYCQNSVRIMHSNTACHLADSEHPMHFVNWSQNTVRIVSESCTVTLLVIWLTQSIPYISSIGVRILSESCTVILLAACHLADSLRASQRSKASHEFGYTHSQFNEIPRKFE
jgi:hypothetical protein